MQLTEQQKERRRALRGELRSLGLLKPLPKDMPIVPKNYDSLTPVELASLRMTKEECLLYGVNMDSFVYHPPRTKDKRDEYISFQVGNTGVWCSHYLNREPVANLEENKECNLPLVPVAEVLG